MTDIRPFPEPEMSEADLVRFALQSKEQTKRRQQMREALKAVITPVLREFGFTGSCPHFRRLGSKRYDLLTFYFDKYGDRFVIDIGQCNSDFVRAPGLAFAPSNKLNPWYLEAHQRARVQPGPFNGKTESWFRYDDAKTPDDYKRIAESLVPFVERALKMFEDFQHVQKIDQGVSRRASRCRC